MEIEPAILLQFEFAKEVTEQVLTLTTGMLGVTLIVVKDVGRPGRGVTLLISWICFVISLLCGVLTLGALISGLGAKEVTRLPENAGTFAFLQWFLFAAGVAFAVSYMFKAFVRTQAPEPDLADPHPVGAHMKRRKQKARPLPAPEPDRVEAEQVDSEQPAQQTEFLEAQRADSERAPPGQPQILSEPADLEPPPEQPEPEQPGDETSESFTN